MAKVSKRKREAEKGGTPLSKALTNLMKQRVESVVVKQKPLPNINDVTMAFHRFFTASNSARLKYGIRDQDEWQKALDKAQKALKAELAACGLADRIDWTDEA